MNFFLSFPVLLYVSVLPDLVVRLCRETFSLVGEELGGNKEKSGGGPLMENHVHTHMLLHTAM